MRRMRHLGPVNRAGILPAASFGTGSVNRPHHSRVLAALAVGGQTRSAGLIISRMADPPYAGWQEAGPAVGSGEDLAAAVLQVS